MTESPNRPSSKTARGWRGAARRVGLWFVPHAHNDYRPHLIRRYGLALILLLIVALQSFHFVFFSGQILGGQSDITAEHLLTKTNQERTAQNLGALKLNPELTDAAQKKAENMLRIGYWSHDAPDGTTPWHWIEATGYKYADAGENLARGFATTDDILRAWLESPTHRANVLDKDFTEVGFATVAGEMNDQKTILVVAIYARPVATPNAGDVLAGGTERVGQTEATVDFWSRLRRGMQNLTPSLLVTLVLLGLATCVALLAHTYRKRLPKSLRQSWYRHHALYKIGIFVVIATAAVLSYGGGMI